jgi:hypothetical protein
MRNYQDQRREGGPKQALETWCCPAAWLMALMISCTLRASRPVAMSRRSTGMPTVVLAAAARIRRSPAEQGSF